MNRPVEMYDDGAIWTADDNMTFAEAFAAARDAMGAGGVFSWHGQVYGTYYQDEWAALSPEQQQAFTAGALHVEPVVDTTPQLADNDELEVQIVGLESVDTAHGPVNLATLDVHGHSVYMVDLDNDSVFDYAMGDFDGSGHILDSSADIMDISSSGLTVGDIGAAIDDMGV